MYTGHDDADVHDVMFTGVPCRSATRHGQNQHA
jgi:hypothetical protein